MRSQLVLLVLALSACLHGAASDQGMLRYRAVLTYRDNREPVVAEFLLRTTPVAKVRNRTKKPRMGGWRLEPIQRLDAPGSQAVVLLRLERLLYLSGPAPDLVAKPVFARYGGRRCQVWHVPIPPGLQAEASLVTAAPGLLALSSFSGRFDKGELATLDLRLVDFRLPRRASPAERGMALLGTLRRLAKAPESFESGNESPEVVE
ncbi:MAG TPA: hypothetical protein PLA48_11275 [Holophaga sp.]|nr:hypothetical protein [Holophaga sp.]